MIAAPAACLLFIRKENRSVRSAGASGGECICICGTRNLREMQLASEYGSGKCSLKRCQIEHL
jgi:hypothetical protein